MGIQGLILQHLIKIISNFVWETLMVRNGNTLEGFMVLRDVLGK